MDKQTLINRFSEAIEKGNAAIFAGAGLSMSQGYVSWPNLLAGPAEELGLNSEKETDLVALAQYYKNENGGSRGILNQILIENFGAELEVSENHRILASLPIETYWTTNYDHLIENSIKDAYKTPQVKKNYTQLATTYPNVDTIIYKMHGDIDDVSSAVITRDDYERYDDDSYTLFKETLKGDLLTKTFLFLGFSFTDPNLERILSDIRWVLKENQRPHYCIMRKISEDSFINSEDFFDQERYNYECKKRKLQISDLSRFSINVVEVDNYSDITDILKCIRKKYLKKTIFISGSAADYSPFSSETEGLKFVEKLAYKLSESGYKIISGYGFGIGNSIVSGVLKQRRNAKKNNLQDVLSLRPLPLDMPSEWTEYRKNMIAESGISIFIFGNKCEGDKIVEATGLSEEFDISVQNGNAVVPIGFTKGTSKMLFEKVRDNFSDYFGESLEEEFQVLEKLDDGNKIDQKIEQIVNLIRCI